MDRHLDNKLDIIKEMLVLFAIKSGNSDLLSGITELDTEYVKIQKSLQ